MRRICVAIYAVFVICVIFATCATAETVNDGFHAAKKIKSRYFTILVEDGIDLDRLAMRLSVPQSIRAIIKEPVTPSGVSSLPDELDTLYLAISEIMDIHLGRFKCKLKICKDMSSLSGIAKRLFGQRVQTGGFYVTQIDTLYVDAGNISIHILGHELSHAIQCHYFVVPPPMKIQEVLAGYVEFQLRKYTNSLPK